MYLKILLLIITAGLPALLPVFDYKSKTFWVWYGVFLFAVIIHSISSVLERNYFDKAEINNFLQKYYRVIEREINKRGKISDLRISIWVPRTNFRLKYGFNRWLRHCLVIFHCKNYDGKLAKFWRLPSGTGLVGMAFRKAKTLGARFEEISLNELMGEGLSFIEARMVKAEKIADAISIPIKEKENVLGVLKIESSSTLQNNLFQNKKFHLRLEKVARAIIPILKKKKGFYSGNEDITLYV